MAQGCTIFLGAGASVDAGYPLTVELFSKLEEYHLNPGCEVIQRQEWNKFINYRRRATGRIGSILKSSNLELVLSLPDLLAASIEDYDSETKKQINQMELSQEKIQHWSSRVQHPIHTQLHEARNISNICLKSLENFFNYLSFIDYCKYREEQLPNYYQKMVSDFDNVITTNWDSLSERILFSNNQWSPYDGYGIELSGIRKKNYSEKMIYKLHGSAGWRRDPGTNSFFLDDAFKEYLLNDHALTSKSLKVEPAESEYIFITPSYFKQLNNEHIIKIWQKAYHAIGNSSKICIVGYSLPNADSAIRALLLAAMGKEIEVIDPCSDNQKKWDAFFGSGNYNFIPKSAIEHFDG